VGNTQEAKKEVVHILPDVDEVFSTPKPTRLLKRILQIATDPGDIVLDSFAGSGTFGHSVLESNKETNEDRQFILVELDANIAKKITAQRLRNVVEGHAWKGQGGKSVEGSGGGFKYCTLDAPLFGADGSIRSEVSFNDLARHVFFTETGEPLPDSFEATSPLLGVANGQAIYLLFNGILGDKTENGGNVLTRRILEKLPRFEGPKVIYGEGCLLSKAFLQAENITFRQLPYEIRIQ
jgi:site-specific DNA-methyltransferase (adenine-specific)/adenine-specific DNA-methyltransferase